METTHKTNIKVSISADVPVEKVWKLWTGPQHIIRWNSAQEDWHTTYAENDLREGGRFISRMEAKDGSYGFDFMGTYLKIKPHKLIKYTLDDSRIVEVQFTSKGNTTLVDEVFEPEQTNSYELQQAGWQSILNHFKAYAKKYEDGDILHFEIVIEAPADKVYKIMIDPLTYCRWTSAFNPKSTFEGSWEKGKKILFIGEDPNSGGTGGMTSQIKENIRGRYISIESKGIVKDGIEITNGPEVEKWIGKMENYTFTEKDGRTILEIDIDSDKEWSRYFQSTWPKALQVLKHMCEAGV
jgi:uncharacterized protein YndB with AHSA1/START domain